MNTLKINIPEGFRIETFDQATGEITFAALPKLITDRIKTFDDVAAYHGFNPEDFEASCHDMTSSEVAYRRIVLIVQALNEGWTPDWSNSNEYKYYPWFKMGDSSGSGFSFHVCAGDRSNSVVGSRLCFKSSELAEYAGKQFTEIYKQFFLIQ